MATITPESVGPGLRLPIEKDESSEVKGVAATESSPTLDKDESIIFINAKPTLPAAALAHLKKLQTDVDITSSFYWVKGVVAVEAKKAESSIPSWRIRAGKLYFTTDFEKQSCSRAQRLSTRAATNNVKTFEVGKDQLHAEIFKTILENLPFPEGVEKGFGKVLPSIGEGLRNKDEPLRDQEHRWILVTTYQYDSVQEKVFATDFEKDRSGNASLVLGYQQTDFDFNQIIWDALKEYNKTAVDTWSGKNTKKLLEIPV